MSSTTKSFSLIALSTTVAAALAFGQSFAAQSQPGSTGIASTTTAPALILVIDGVRSDKGKIRAALLKADPATGAPQSTAGKVIVATKGTLTMSFENLSPGDYAVQLFHDENDNGKMDSNLFGIPSEGFGFSNNARANFGPPAFAQMKVNVTAGPVRTTATLAY
jgi:uncharacterized protein (DUF2141 family)